LPAEAVAKVYLTAEGQNEQVEEIDEVARWASRYEEVGMASALEFSRMRLAR
jgi:hypothetical protein